LELELVLLADDLLPFFQSASELRSLFNLLASNEHLRVQCPYLLFQPLLLLFLLEELPVPLLQRVYRSRLILLGPSLLLFQLHKVLMVIHMAHLFVEFLLKLAEFYLVFS